MGIDQRPCAIAIMGPTASGKSACALSLARQFQGEIINMDSAAIYIGLDIGTAKPNPQMRAEIPHHMLDVTQPWRPVSAADFARLARRELDAIVDRQRLPILVGGTGLYFRALLTGLAPLPSANPAIRAAVTADAAARGWPALHGDLARVDPDAARRIKENDGQRIQRALEVYRLTGRPLTYWQHAAEQPPRLPVRLLKCVVAPERRADLGRRIAQRFAAMLTAGFLAEVADLRRTIQELEIENPHALPALRAVGYRQAWSFLDGDIDYETFYMQSVQATKHLAKRQLTWCRSQLDARWFDPEDAQIELTAAVRQFVKPRPRVDYG